MRYVVSVAAVLCWAASFAQSIESGSSRSRIDPSTAIDTCRVRMTYAFRYAIDTVRRKPLHDRAVLEIGRSRTLCYSAYARAIDSLFRSGAKEVNARKICGMQAGERERYEDVITNYPAEGELSVSTNFWGTEYRYAEALPQIRWQVDPAPADSLLGYACHRAEGRFRGRTYVVWFSSELPFPHGPWKLGGLPGLILRAESADGLFAWEAVAVERPHSARPIVCYDPSSAGRAAGRMKFRALSREEMRRIERMLWSDPIALARQHGREYMVGVKDPASGKVRFYEEPGSYQAPYIPPLELE